MRTMPIAALALALSVGASTLTAQPGRGARADGPRDRATPAMRGGGSPAEALLRQRTRIELTDEQVTRLEALAQSQRAARTASPGEALRLRADLMDAMAGDGDPKAARVALDKLSAARNDQIVLGMRALQEAQAILTPAQRAKLDEARGQRPRFAMQGGGRRGPGQARGMRAPQGRAGAVRPDRNRGGARGLAPRVQPAPPLDGEDLRHGN